MGGRQTLTIALTDSAEFAYMGAFRSGWFPNALKEEVDTDLAQHCASGKPFRFFWVNAGKFNLAAGM